MNIFRTLLALVLLVAATAGMIVPATSAPNGWPDGDRKVWVLSDVPHDFLTLQFLGSKTEVIHQFYPGWQKTSRGYEAQITMPRWYFYRWQSVRLVGSIGDTWSHWHEVHTQYLRNNDVTRGDPACVGGKGWCAIRGL